MDANLMSSVIALVLFILLVFFFAVALAIRYRKRKRENEELQERLATERLKIQAEVQEETLQHISRELHDNLGHIASLVKINLNTIITEDEALSAKIEETKELTRQLIGDIKRLSLRMGDDPLLQGGLVAAIEKEVDRLNRSGAIQAILELGGDIPVIEDTKAIILFRMIQEGINNTLKHSAGKNLSIRLEHIDKSIILVLQDDGRGFTIEKQLNGDGAGLANLKKRAALLNASMNVQSAPGHGTSITIKMPY
jgi:signal transduction histidine kinase